MHHSYAELLRQFALSIFDKCASINTRRRCRRRCRRRRISLRKLIIQEITNEHFLSALLDQGEGITRPLLEKLGANVDQLRDRLRSELERRPKIHGAAADVRLSNELRSVLDSARRRKCRN